jgi:SAM-dependent methyltransferase
VSAPLLDLANKRAQALHPSRDGTRPSFYKVDASSTFMDPPFDQMISRFGVMFFADPVAAFVNLKRLLVPQGQLSFVCWRSPAENDWVNVPMRALQGLIPATSDADPEEPGPFAFADQARLRMILASAGFSDLKITPFEGPMLMGGKGVEEVAAFMAEIGPAARALADLPVERRPLAIERLRAGLEPHLQDRRLILSGAVWLVEAVA